MSSTRGASFVLGHFGRESVSAPRRPRTASPADGDNARRGSGALGEDSVSTPKLEGVVALAELDLLDAGVDAALDAFDESLRSRRGAVLFRRRAPWTGVPAGSRGGRVRGGGSRRMPRGDRRRVQSGRSRRGLRVSGARLVTPGIGSCCELRRQSSRPPARLVALTPRATSPNAAPGPSSFSGPSSWTFSAALAAAAVVIASRQSPIPSSRAASFATSGPARSCSPLRLPNRRRTRSSSSPEIGRACRLAPVQPAPRKEGGSLTCHQFLALAQLALDGHPRSFPPPLPSGTGRSRSAAPAHSRGSRPR